MKPISLDRFQREVLDGFFNKESRFFLTGGAALVGFYLGHRQTQDLDLFTTKDLLEEGIGALRTTARELGASVEVVRTVSAADLRLYLQSLRDRLARLAFPDEQ